MTFTYTEEHKPDRPALALHYAAYLVASKEPAEWGVISIERRTLILARAFLAWLQEQDKP